MTEGTTSAAAKPKAPRRVGTKIAGATTIATTHAAPSELLRLLKALPLDRAKLLGGLDAEIETMEKALGAKRADYRGRKEFASEIEGLDDMTLVGIAAMLEARTPK